MRERTAFVNEKNLFFILILLTVGAFWLTHPFMKYPFDMFQLQLWIDQFYLDPDKVPGFGKFYWIKAWAAVFRWIDMDTTHIFERVYIIHRTQLLFTFFTLLYLSYTLARKLFLDIPKMDALYLGYLSALLWLLFFATSSVGEHHVWIQWYSLNYQVTLPMVLLSLALTVRFLFDPLKPLERAVTGLAILALLSLVSLFHSMELIYYLLYLGLLLLFFTGRIITLIRRYPGRAALLVLFLGAGSYYFLFHFIPHMVNRDITLLAYIGRHDWAGLHRQILQDGHLMLTRYNREGATVHLLFPLSLALWVAMAFFKPFTSRLKLPPMDTRFWFFLFVTSWFAYIPLNLYTAGLASTLSYLFVAYRFYFSSLIFLALPFGTYFFLSPLFRRRPAYWIVPVFVLQIGLLVLVSKLSDHYHHNFAKNVSAFAQMFDERAVGFQLSKAQRERVGELLQTYGAQQNLHKTMIFAREDIAFVVRHVYGYRNVYLPDHWNGRHIAVDGYLEAYKKYRGEKLLLPVPPDFPPYTPYH